MDPLDEPMDELPEITEHSARPFRAPTWVTVIALGIGAFGIVFGLLELFNPGSTGLLFDGKDFLNVAEESAAKGWGVRNMALGVTMIAAVLFRHPGGYVVAFIGGLAREGGDLFATLGEPNPTTASLLLIGLFVVLEGLCLLALLATGVRHRLS